MADVVLVTGASRYLGARYARTLAARADVGRVIGVDIIAPPYDIGDAEFVRADIRNPMIGKVIEGSRVDTVVHMNVIATPVAAGGRVCQKEINVIGTMQLLAACQQAPSLRRLVVKSSSAVYGSSPRDPVVFTESTPPQVLPRSGFAKDSIEVEGYVRGLSRRRPDVEVSVLRFANVIGPAIRTELTDYFALPVIPTPLGFDGRLQFVHERDAVRAMVLATIGPAVDMVNVAGDGVLTLSQAARLVRRPTVPVPVRARGAIGSALKRARLVDFSPEQMQFLSFGRVLDTSRMREVLGLEPDYTTRQAFEDYVDGHARSFPGGELVETVIEDALGSAAGLVNRVLGATR